ncbi:hypothetical protein BC826DRAFT_1058706 [Russula brevipes]|nr:hypothetical protein BC826DRAFT_1058706 [Russula brevipes]
MRGRLLGGNRLGFMTNRCEQPQELPSCQGLFVTACGERCRPRTSGSSFDSDVRNANSLNVRVYESAPALCNPIFDLGAQNSRVLVELNALDLGLEGKFALAARSLRSGTLADKCSLKSVLQGYESPKLLLGGFQLAESSTVPRLGIDFLRDWGRRGEVCQAIKSKGERGFVIEVVRDRVIGTLQEVS